MAVLFVQLDVHWPDNPKIMRVGLAGAGLHAAAMCMAKRMEADGVLHRTHLYRLGADDELINHCIDEGLFDVIEYGSRAGEDPGWGYVVRIHDWHDRNLSQDAIASIRYAKKEGAREGNHKRWKHPGPLEECPKCNQDNPSVLASDRIPVGHAKRVRSPEIETEIEIIASDPDTSKSTPSTRNATKEKDALWDALVAEIGDATTQTARSNRGKTVKELLAAGATPADVKTRCDAYRKRYPNASLTDAALRKHWDNLTVKPGRDGREFDEVLGVYVDGHTKGRL